MPTPATGQGADVSKGLQKFTFALYLADASGAAALPGAKLLANEPASPWVRQGRIKGDEFTWNVADPSFLEGRAGFAKVLKFRVVNQAEMPQLTVPLDESDPIVMAHLRGSSTATSLSSGAYTGYQFIYKPGLFYNAKVLLVGTAVTGGKERHFYAPNAYVTFKPVTQPDEDGIEVMIVMGVDTSSQAFYENEWD